MALSLSILIPAVNTVMAGGSVEFKTLILTINKGKFNPNSVKALGGRVDYIAQLAPIAVIKVPTQAASKIASLPGVLHISEDAVVHIFKGKPSNPGKGKGGGGSTTQPPQVIPWGISYIEADKVWGTYNVTGSPISVAIIDTGVDMDHPDLAQNIGWCVTVLSRGINQKITYGECDDDNGHGTHVAGIIAAENNDIGVVGVSPSVNLYVFKALSRTGSGYVSDIIKAIDIAVRGPDGILGTNDDPKVISMSFGSDTSVSELDEELQAAYNDGITLVAAAGNEGSSTPDYPAAYTEVIAVGAIDSTGGVPEWSNRNPELTAPGVDIYSTYPDDSYTNLSGTSMACPHVSGTVALIQAARLAYGLPLLPPGNSSDFGISSVRGILHVTAMDLGSEGYDYLYGYGVVNASAAVAKAISSG